jgi:2'-5' RNA ligase
VFSAPASTFLALWPPADVRERLHRLAIGLRAGGERVVAPADLHLTLLYLGPLDDEQRRAVVLALAGLRCPAFRLVLDRFGVFRRSRVLWAGPRIVPPTLALLAALLAALDLPRAGSRPLENRPFRPHVSLLREVREMQDRALAPPLLWPVRSLVLAARLPVRGRAYRLLARWPLTTEAGPRGDA